jgi:hypothetical protein
MWRRRLLIVLLVLALPLQGYAAASMLGCAPVPPSPAAHEQDAHAAHAAHASHKHGAGVSLAEGHAPHHTAASADEDNAHAVSGGGKCSQCAVCSVGVALLPALPLLDATAAPQSVVRQPSRLPAAFLTGGIERPPRTLRA